MLNWLGALVGTDKAVDNIMDKDNGHLAKAGAWFGNLMFTDEEKAKNNAELAKIAIDKLKALEPFKVMQRIMVTIIMVEWAILANCVIVCILCNYMERVTQLMMFAQTPFMWLPISGAVGLYLMGGVIKPKESK